MSDYKNYSDSERDDEVYSTKVKAGRRTYFFDIKPTKGDEYYITITESRKKTNADGSFSYDKSKVYIYKEDMMKFSNGLADVINFIKENRPEYLEPHEQEQESLPTLSEKDFDSL
ncbi:MAG: DUF3276 family protein [Rikenellaceae bacterium]